MSVNPTDLQPGQTLARYVKTLWGDKTRLVPKQTVAILTTATRVAKNNPRRMMLMVVNRGTGGVDVDWNSAPVLGDGIPLAATGGTLILTAFEDGELTGYELTGIAAAVGNTVDVYEVETL